MATKPPDIDALIVAAGSGERFGSTLPKQYQPLLGKPVLRWSVDVFRNHACIRDVYVAIHPDHTAFCEKAMAGLSLPPFLMGGKTRQETVLRALESIAKKSRPDFILIHDAARPALDETLISALCGGLTLSGAVVPGLPVADTLRRKNGKTENRDSLYAVQTPQAFIFDEILELHRTFKDTPVTDDASLFDLASLPVKIIEGSRNNTKITRSDDLPFIEQVLSLERADVRTGQGYDVHRLVTPQDIHQKLKIGGVEFRHDKVLEGHSDADVALHALTDALLATVCEGDIGMHFNPKDAQWKGADSAAFLRFAADKIINAEGVINHIDLTIICEEPKIGPRREDIRARIAEILALPISRISVKATTTEGLGFTGRREGIAAQAVATVRLPFYREFLYNNKSQIEEAPAYAGMTG